MSKTSNIRTLDTAEDGQHYVQIWRRLGSVCQSASKILQAIRVGAPVPKAAVVTKGSNPSSLKEGPRVSGTAPTIDMAVDELAAVFSSVMAEGSTPVPAERAPSMDITPEMRASIGPAARGPYLDPLLCRCEDMIAATRHRSVIDISPAGPVLYRASPELSDPLAFPDDAWTLVGSFFALRHCPFDGQLMDAYVPVRERGAAGEDGSPYCCAWLREAHERGKVTLTTLRRDVLAATLRFGPTPTPFWHCSGCGEKTILTNHARSLFYRQR